MEAVVFETPWTIEFITFAFVFVVGIQNGRAVRYVRCF